MLAPPEPEVDRLGQVQVNGQWLDAKEVIGNVKEDRSLMQAAPPRTNTRWCEDLTPGMAKRLEKCIDSIMLWCPVDFSYRYEEDCVVRNDQYYQLGEKISCA